jgi:rare lipoprotein A
MAYDCRRSIVFELAAITLYWRSSARFLARFAFTLRLLSRSASAGMLFLFRLVVCVFSERRQYVAATGVALMLFQGCAIIQSPFGTTPQPAPSQPAPAQPAEKKPAPATLPQTGEASWYGAQHQGKQTASGTTYDQAALTAAHRSLPFGSKVKVTNLANGKSVEVEINDRGPFTENRIIDLSEAAAKTLGMIESGTANVRLELPSGQ